MQIITASIVIGRQVDEVFVFITNARNDPLWRSTVGLPETRQLTDGAVDVGSQITETWRFMGMNMQATDEVTEYEPDKRYTRRLLTGSRPVVQETFVVEPVANGTRWTSTTLVQVDDECPVAEPMLAAHLKRATTTSMAKAKRLLERRVVDNAR